MEYEDTRTIATPEGVELRLRLAGVGSRFGAGLIDILVKVSILSTAFIGAAITGGGVAAIVVVGVVFLFASVFFDVLMEVRAGGRTPGKMALGLRVVLADGRPVGLRASCVRNLLRLIEGLPTSYVPAIVSILVTKDNQRLGDLAAGTIVVHDRAQGAAMAPSRAMMAPPAHTTAWDVSAITPQDLATVRSFLARRHGFTPEAREKLAEQLATGFAPRVGGAPPGQPPERFLEDLARAKESRI